MKPLRTKTSHFQPIPNIPSTNQKNAKKYQFFHCVANLNCLGNSSSYQQWIGWMCVAFDVIIELIGLTQLQIQKSVKSFKVKTYSTDSVHIISKTKYKIFSSDFAFYQNFSLFGTTFEQTNHLSYFASCSSTNNCILLLSLILCLLGFSFFSVRTSSED